MTLLVVVRDLLYSVSCACIKKHRLQEIRRTCNWKRFL